MTGFDAYEGAAGILYQEPLIWVVGQGVELSALETIPLALLPPPCRFRRVATELLEKACRTWEVSFTGTSMTGVQAAVQAGIGISILPKGALRKGLRMYSLARIVDEAREDDARDVFIGYLEAEPGDLQEDDLA